VAGDVEGEFEAGPHSELIERGAEIILHHLLARAKHRSDIFIGETLPNQGGNLNFLGG
jgi:hypothetical protein